jgi:DNA repair protein RadA/Sms
MNTVTRSPMDSPSLYVCKACGASTDRWVARCPRCQAWSTASSPRTPQPPPGAMPARSASAPALVSVPEAPRPSRARPISSPIPITDVDASTEPRLVTGIEPLDRVLGGGLVVGSLVLLGGEPGIGKSTLLAQLLAAVSCERVLYASGEESITQVAMRARRVQAAYPRIQIVTETDVDSVLAHAEGLRPEILAIDSIHTLMTADVGSIAGSVAQVRECTARLAAFAKSRDLTTVVIGHVTKDGGLAGPKTLEHLVDVVLQFELGQRSSLRELRAHKNRYGSTQEIGCFEMTGDGLRPTELILDATGNSPDVLLPLARELLERYLASGGVVDPELRVLIEQSELTR